MDPAGLKRFLETPEASPRPAKRPRLGELDERLQSIARASLPPPPQEGESLEERVKRLEATLQKTSEEIEAVRKTLPSSPDQLLASVFDPLVASIKNDACKVELLKDLLDKNLLQSLLLSLPWSEFTSMQKNQFWPLLFAEVPPHDDRWKLVRLNLEQGFPFPDRADLALYSCLRRSLRPFFFAVRIEGEESVFLIPEDAGKLLNGASRVRFENEEAILSLPKVYVAKLMTFFTTLRDNCLPDSLIEKYAVLQIAILLGHQKIEKDCFREFLGPDKAFETGYLTELNWRIIRNYPPQHLDEFYALCGPAMVNPEGLEHLSPDFWDRYTIIGEGLLVNKTLLQSLPVFRVEGLGIEKQIPVLNSFSLRDLRSFFYLLHFNFLDLPISVNLLTMARICSYYQADELQVKLETTFLRERRKSSSRYSWRDLFTYALETTNGFYSRLQSTFWEMVIDSTRSQEEMAKLEEVRESVRELEAFRRFSREEIARILKFADCVVRMNVNLENWNPRDIAKLTKLEDLKIGGSSFVRGCLITKEVLTAFLKLPMLRRIELNIVGEYEALPPLKKVACESLTIRGLFHPALQAALSQFKALTELKLLDAHDDNLSFAAPSLEVVTMTRRSSIPLEAVQGFFDKHPKLRVCTIKGPLEEATLEWIRTFTREKSIEFTHVPDPS